MVRTVCLFFPVCVSLVAERPHIRRFNDHIYYGKQPNKEEFTNLARVGIKTVLDLRGGRIHKPRDEKRVEAAGMQYISIRLSGLFPPKDAQIVSVLAVLEDPTRQPVFVHCWRGVDRVGLVLACYRIAHDHWLNKQALAEARRDGLNPVELLLQRYIRHFDPARVGVATSRSADWRTAGKLPALPPEAAGTRSTR